MNRNIQFFRIVLAVLPIAAIAACAGDPVFEDGNPSQGGATTIPQGHVYAIAAAPICGTVNENSSIALACPSGQIISAVEFASYGSPSGSCGALAKGSCDASTSLSVVSSACIGKSSCGVSAENSTFGDPCLGTAKRLYVQVTCSASVCGTVDENGSVTLECPSGQTITAVGFASYGTPSGSCGAFATGSCDASTSLSVTSNACIGKSSCSVSASNSTFGDPCLGTHKQFYAQMTCEALGTGGVTGTGGAGGGAIGSGSASGSGGTTPPSTLPSQALHCFVDDGSPAGSDIALTVVPNRSSGVAPLAVFFDTLGTSATATKRPFHELGYCWNFGDTGAGAFSTTGLSKNLAKGPVAAHVFEKSGTYTVTVNARDAKGRVAAQVVQIVVQEPATVFGGTSTVCMSSAGDFTGCPTGGTQLTASTLSSLNASVAANRRLLLHSGETFTDDGTGVDLLNSGPGLIGSYGTGARPIIKATGGKATYLFNIGTGFSDWRIMDLDVQSNGTDGIVNITGKATNLLALRVKGTNIGTALMASTNALRSNQDIIDGPAVVDCEFRASGVNGASTMFISARRFALLGNILRNVATENGQHVVRTPWVERFVVSSNDFSDIQSNGGLLKLNALHNSDASGNAIPWTTATGYSERVSISDNVFNGEGGGTFLVGAGPQNADFDERVRDVIFERNLFLPGPSAALTLALDGVDLTIRDNIFNRGQSGACIDIAQYAAGVPPTGITILNNVCYSDGTHPPLLVTFDDQSVAAVYNNLVTSPKGGTVVGSGKQITQAGNLVTTTPGFLVSSPMLAPDFQLTSNSAAIDKGDSTLVSFWDYAGHNRPVDGNGDGTAVPDVGAYEFGAK